MIDVHVLTHEGTRPDDLERCLASLEGQACTVHVVDNAGYPVGPGRAAGYGRGNHPFVSYLDSDDEALPGTYERLLTELEKHRAVCTLERVITVASGYVCPTPNPMHAVVGARRSDIEPLISRMPAAPWCVDMLVRKELQPTQLDWVGVNAYVRNGTAREKLNSRQFKEEFARWHTQMDR